LAEADDVGKLRHAVRGLKRLLGNLPANVAGNVGASGLIYAAGELLAALG